MHTWNLHVDEKKTQPCTLENLEHALVLIIVVLFLSFHLSCTYLVVHRLYKCHIFGHCHSRTAVPTTALLELNKDTIVPIRNCRNSMLMTIKWTHASTSNTDDDTMIRKSSRISRYDREYQTARWLDYETLSC